MSIYVVSTGRSGTHLLQELVELALPEVEIGHQGPGSRALNIIGNLGLGNAGARALLPWCVRLLRGQRALRSTADPLLSVTLALLESARSPDSKIIHLVRDPRTFVASFMNWKSTRFKRWILHHLVPAWQPSPAIAGEPGIIQSIRMEKFERFCWVWTFKNRFFAQRLAGRSGYLLVRLEQLTRREARRSEVARLERFLGTHLDFAQAEALLKTRPNRGQRRRFPGWKDWGPKEAALLDLHCGELMRKWGYGNEAEWIRLVRAGRAGLCRK